MDHGKKILIIDDDPHLVDMMQMRLESEGYTVIKAFDGEEGLYLAKRENPDMVILDVLMPRMDGYTFVREFRSLDCGKDIPMMVLTGKEKMKDLFAIEGIREYVLKPFKAEDLLKTIRRLLDEADRKSGL